MAFAIDPKQHIDYETADDGMHGQRRIYKLYSPKEAMQKAVHINYIANRAVGKTALKVIRSYFDTDSKSRIADEIISKYGMAKIARYVLPSGVFEFSKEDTVDDIGFTIQRYENGEPASDTLYSHDIISEFNGKRIDGRMWLYPPEQAKRLSPQDRYLNQARISVYRAIYPILRKYINRDNKLYTWDEMAEDCYSVDVDDDDYMEAYGVVTTERRNDYEGEPKDKWVMHSEPVGSPFMYHALEKQIARQKQFRNGTLKVVRHDEIEAYYKKHIANKSGYGSEMDEDFNKALKNPDLITFKYTLSPNKPMTIPYISDKTDVDRYLDYCNKIYTAD